MSQRGASLYRFWRFGESFDEIAGLQCGAILLAGTAHVDPSSRMFPGFDCMRSKFEPPNPLEVTEPSRARRRAACHENRNPSRADRGPYRCAA